MQGAGTFYLLGDPCNDLRAPKATCTLASPVFDDGSVSTVREEKDDGKMASSTSHVLRGNQYLMLPYLSFEFNNNNGASNQKCTGVSRNLVVALHT